MLSPSSVAIANGVTWFSGHNLSRVAVSKAQSILTGKSPFLGLVGVLPPRRDTMSVEEAEDACISVISGRNHSAEVSVILPSLLSMLLCKKRKSRRITHCLCKYGLMLRTRKVHHNPRGATTTKAAFRYSDPIDTRSQLLA